MWRIRKSCSRRFVRATDKSGPAQLVLTIDPAHSTLHWTLDTTLHLVHGTFAIKRGEVTVDPAIAPRARQAVERMLAFG